jgi:hypothetical protein
MNLTLLRADFFVGVKRAYFVVKTLTARKSRTPAYNTFQHNEFVPTYLTAAADRGGVQCSTMAE